MKPIIIATTLTMFLATSVAAQPKQQADNPPHRLNRGYLLPPGTPFNSRGEPYSLSLARMSPQQRKNVAESMAWIKAHMRHPEAWCFDWSRVPNLTAHIPSDKWTKRTCRRTVH